MKLPIAAVALLAAPAAFAQSDPGDVEKAKATAPVAAAAPVADSALAAIYSNALGAGWQNWSWAKSELSVDIGSARKPIRIEAQGYQGLYLHHTPFSTAPYRGLTFLIQGSAPSQVRVIAIVGGKPVEGKLKLVKVGVGGWNKVVVALADLGAANIDIDGFWIQNDSADPIPPFYVADIALTT